MFKIKKRNLMSYLTFVIATFLFTFSSCGGDEGTDGENYLTLDVSSVIFDMDGITSEGLSSCEVYVNTNMSFNKLSIHPRNSWCKLTTNSSESSISIRVEPNRSGSFRTTTIVVSGGGLQEIINVVQYETSYNEGGGGDWGDGGDDDGGDETGISAPKNVMASTSGSSIVVSWNRVSNASSYDVYRSSSASGNYSYIGESYSTSFYDRSPLKGSNYYKVKALSTYNESFFSTYAYCNADGGSSGSTQKPTAPTKVTCENKAPVLNPSIYISWDAVENATSYQVYRSSIAETGYTKLGNSTSSTYVYDNSPKKGDNYYKVKAINDAGESGFSDYTFYENDPQSVLEPPAPNVTISGLSPVKLTWTVGTSSNMGIAKEFKVYKVAPNTGKYELITTTTNKSYTDYSPHPGPNRYAVRSVSESGKESAPVYVITKDWVPLAAPTGFKATKSGRTIVNFTWNQVAQATGYSIYYSVTDDYYYPLVEIDGGKTTSYKYTAPSTIGGTLYYRIIAIYSAEALYSDVKSDLSSSYSIVTY